VAGVETYEAARRRRERATADLRELELQQRRGEVLDRRTTLRQVERFVREERDAWVAVPSDVCEDGAAELGVDVRTLRLWLERVMRAHLESRARRLFRLAEEAASRRDGGAGEIDGHAEASEGEGPTHGA
jgi:hypothetical protein